MVTGRLVAGFPETGQNDFAGGNSGTNYNPYKRTNNCIGRNVP